MRSSRSEFRATMEQYGLVPDRGVISLLAVLTVIWFIQRVGGHEVSSLFSHLILIPSRAIGPEPWQLFTSMFVDVRLGMVLGSAVTLLFFGNAVERARGAFGVWKIFIVGGLASALAWALVGLLLLPGLPHAGSSMATTAMLTAFAAGAGGMQMRFFGSTMRSSTIAWVWLGISAIFIVAEIADQAPWQAVVMALAALAGAAAAGWFVGGGRRARRGGLDVRGSLEKVRLWRLKRRYKVLSGGRDDKRYLN
jgi:membrane associated rhomboid family serine protease